MDSRTKFGNVLIPEPAVWDIDCIADIERRQIRSDRDPYDPKNNVTIFHGVNRRIELSCPFAGKLLKYIGHIKTLLLYWEPDPGAGKVGLVIKKSSLMDIEVSTDNQTMLLSFVSGRF